jgi:peptide/nickel transport system substrate-binding protein
MLSRTRATPRRYAIALCIAALAVLVAAVAASASRTQSTAGDTLVVDKSFDLKTADPQRQYEPTGGIVDRALYDTLLKFKGGDVAHPLPSVATKYTVSKNATAYTFTLRKDVKFSDGTPLTSKDVVFSYNRLVNLKANPSFLLAGIKTSAAGPYTVVLRSATPNPAIPVLVANTSLGIVNSKAVKAHGGSDAADADKTDKAESFLNSQSAGSGPYVLKSYSTTTQVVMTANTKYWGAAKPHFKNVVLRNVNSAAQLLNIQRGTNEVSLDLSPDQAKGLVGKKSLTIERTPSANVWFLFANANAKVSATSSNPHIQNAIRFALDYNGYVRVAGSGAARAAGVVPTMFLGALKSSAVKTSLAKAKAEVAASGIKNPKVKLEFPSDITSNGLSFGVMAQKVKSDLEAAGISVELAGSPVATSLNSYRDGTEELGLWYWGPDYPDPNDYLVFLPGETVGLRAGWAAGAYPALEALGKKAGSTATPAARAKLFQQIQTQLNAKGPFYPLVQPGQVVASSSNLTGTTFNVVYWIDVTAVGSR